MTPQQEAAFERKAEQHFKGHRGSPLGRDFRAFRYRYDVCATCEKFKSRFDATFPNAPGGRGWWDRKFGGM